MKNNVRIMKNNAITMKNDAVTMTNHAITMHNNAKTMNNYAIIMKNNAIIMKSHVITMQNHTITIKKHSRNQSCSRHSTEVKWKNMVMEKPCNKLKYDACATHGVAPIHRWMRFLFFSFLSFTRL